MRIFFYCLLFLSILSCKDSKQTGSSYQSQNQLTSKKQLTQKFKEGKKIYQNKCAQCHLSNGKGIPNIYPPLRNSNWLTEKRKESIRAVKYGLQGPIIVNGKEYDNVMLPLNLSDKEVVEVLNYVMNSWGNKQDKKVTLEEVDF